MKAPAQAKPPEATQTAPNLIHLRTGGLTLDVPESLIDAIAAGVAARVSALTEPAAPGRLALSKAEAAERLGMSVDHLERHVLPDLRIVRSGRLRLVPVSELEAWLERSAARALEAVA